MVFSFDVSELDKVVENVESEKNNEKIIRFKKLFEIMKSFFKSRLIILYGGTALNYHLPKNRKIYKEDEFPDYDCFSLNPKKDAIDLSEILKKDGYKYIEIKYAMHEGTYKLFVDFEAVCDLTKISKTNHNIIQQQATVIDGFYVTSIKHLKSYAYLELAIPKSALFRWQKIISRIKIMEELFKNNKSRFASKHIQLISFNKKIKDVICELREYAIDKKLVLCGNDAIDHQLNGSKSADIKNGLYMLTNSTGLFQCMSIDAKETVESLKKIIMKHKLENIVVKIENHDFITPYTKIYITYYDDQYTYDKIKLNICTVFSAENHCYSYIKHKGIKYASIFYILHMLYFVLFSNYEKEIIDKVNIKNIINMLIKKVDLNSFKTECYGSEMTMSAIRKIRWDEKKPVVLLRLN
jgi:hypothetical protein